MRCAYPNELDDSLRFVAFVRLRRRRQIVARKRPQSAAISLDHLSAIATVGLRHTSYRYRSRYGLGATGSVTAAAAAAAGTCIA